MGSLTIDPGMVLTMNSRALFAFRFAAGRPVAAPDGERAGEDLRIGNRVINASARANGATIDWVPPADLPDRFTVSYIETGAHGVTFAKGAPAQTFIDDAGRPAFDTCAE